MMVKEKSILSSILILILICLIGIGGVKFYKHEVGMKNDLKVLYDKVNVLEAKVNSSTDSKANEFLSLCDSSHYNIFFIGNSISKHGLADYWWSENRGMAATSNDKDYVHNVISGLKNIEKNPVNDYVYNFATWETLSHDRSEMFVQIDNLLVENIDLIIVQLGENISDYTTLKNDYEELFNHIKDKSPKAKIIVVGNFWKNDKVDEIKKELSGKMDLEYIDLSEIQDKKEYQSFIGEKIQGDDGEIHEVEHAGVAKHPGDLGFKYISDKILERINK